MKRSEMVMEIATQVSLNLKNIPKWNESQDVAEAIIEMMENEDYVFEWEPENE